ncbi:NAD(P)H-hydrate dehydratase [Marinihelvus fidelis]|uniref:NAD(P)H-hydrate dehydratase n=1 Tax=Marinihelvus fidelis TaxID=2613842 RepID=UPI0029660DBC|nr:NAD(P)H-hydrate dehydratase [Marinihelvus fidelis]
MYTAAAVRRLDELAIEAGGGDGYALMCRAGQAVVNVARQHFPDARRWLVVCGAGNNGGDGYVIARLASALGIDVAVVALRQPEQLSGDAGRAAADWRACGGETVPWSGELPAADLVIDALLGTGLARVVEGQWATAIKAINNHRAATVSVDVPSGLGADTGHIHGVSVSADVTVTLVGMKRGLLTADGPDCAGKVVFDTLKVPDTIYDALDGDRAVGRRMDRADIGRLLPRRRLNSHKGLFGHVVVVGGNRGMSGAARLAGEAALRAGAGRVTVATHPVHAHWLNLARPELMTLAVEGGDDVPPQPSDSDVIALGPGLGKDGWARSLVPECLGRTTALVVDADGLNLLAALRDSMAWPRKGEWVITPHPAEAARLLGQSTAVVQADRFAAAATLAEQYGAVVVLKGCGTVVAAPDGRWSLCALGNPGMATAGAGDVLTGVVAAMLAQGLPAYDAACAAVVAHAAAGDVAARNGQVGRLALDFCDALPGVLDV